MNRHSVGALCSCFFLALKLMPDLYQAKAISMLESSCLLNVAEAVWQCPISGSLHFYEKMKILFKHENLCQCPISGSLHFYAGHRKENDMFTEVCQCPISGSLHFYGKWSLMKGKQELCQCPISGSLHFYDKEMAIRRSTPGCVNALSRANFISTYVRSAEQ